MQIPVLKDKIEYFLSDPGLQLRHPNKKDVLLEDIFVFPDLYFVNKEITNSKKLLKINKDKNKISISGIEDSGKTTLMKVLIKHYLNSGYHPVYIDAQHSTITDPTELQEIIDRSYEDMYEYDSLEKIRIENNKKKAIFIDNFDKANKDIRVLNNILKTLCNEFDNLIFTEETPFNMFEDTQLKLLYPELSEEINQYEIIEFNNKLQLELINKWHKLKNINEPEIEITSLKTDKAKKIFDTIVGNNLMPSLPVFLLTILQSNSETESELISGSSYSHYYEYLTLKSIVNSIGNQDLEPYLEFLSELSYHMFKEDKQSASYEELEHIYGSKLEHRGKTKSLELLIQSLINAATLIEKPFYSFRYKYIYHYFVARYLSINIELESVNEQIKHIFRELYNDDYAHIALFLTHLSDDTLIINELLIRTKSIFSEGAIISKEEDSLEIDELIAELSRLGAKDRKLKQAPTEYIANINTTNSHLIQESYKDIDKSQELNRLFENEGFRVENNLIKIVKEVLRNRKNSYI